MSLEILFQTAAAKSISIHLINSTLKSFFNVHIQGEEMEDLSVMVGQKRLALEFRMDRLRSVFQKFLPYLERDYILGVLLYCIDPSSWTILSHTLHIPITHMVLEVLNHLFNLISKLDEMLIKFATNQHDIDLEIEIDTFLRETLTNFLMQSQNIIIRYQMELSKLDLKITYNENNAAKPIEPKQSRPSPVKYIRKFQRDNLVTTMN